MVELHPVRVNDILVGSEYHNVYKDLIADEEPRRDLTFLFKYHFMLHKSNVHMPSTTVRSFVTLVQYETSVFKKFCPIEFRPKYKINLPDEVHTVTTQPLILTDDVDISAEYLKKCVVNEMNSYIEVIPPKASLYAIRCNVELPDNTWYAIWNLAFQISK